MIQRTGIAAKLPFPIHPHTCGIRRATSWQTRARTHVHWRIIWAIGIYNRRPDTLRLRLIDLRSSGGISVWGEPLEARRTLSDFQGPSGLSLPTGTAPKILQVLAVDRVAVATGPSAAVRSHRWLQTSKPGCGPSAPNSLVILSSP